MSSTANTVLGKEITEQPFYKVYSSTWKDLIADIEELQRNSYSKTLEDLVTYVSNNSGRNTLQNYGVDEILPAAALLTGV